MTRSRTSRPAASPTRTSIRAQADGGPGGGDAWLRALYATRAALREVWDAQVEAPHACDRRRSTPSTRSCAQAPRVELCLATAASAVGHRHTDDDPTGEALARVIEPLVEVLATGETDRFRICANDACRWVFEDRSRAGRRRWCDMTSCGNRAKVRRYRSKRKAADADEAGTTAAKPSGRPRAAG